MLKKSAFIYLLGFLFGFLAALVIILLWPGVYEALLRILFQKVEAQRAVIGNFTLMIIANNIVAASIAAYGGTFTSKLIGFFHEGLGRRKAVLYFLPVGILFVNGEVLGFLSVLYQDHVLEFLRGIFPHGFFEIPAILLSGSIGLEISERVDRGAADFQKALGRTAREGLWKFGVVIFLIIVGGVLEGRAL